MTYNADVSRWWMSANTAPGRLVGRSASSVSFAVDVGGQLSVAVELRSQRRRAARISRAGTTVGRKPPGRGVHQSSWASCGCCGVVAVAVGWSRVARPGKAQLGPSTRTTSRTTLTQGADSRSRCSRAPAEPRQGLQRFVGTAHLVTPVDQALAESAAKRTRSWPSPSLASSGVIVPCPAPVRIRTPRRTTPAGTQDSGDDLGTLARRPDHADRRTHRWDDGMPAQ